jgi:ankyrin repeat protein
MAAAANKQKRVVAILLKQPGIKLDVRNSRGETALMHSARAGALDVSDMLISAGARVDLIDNKGMTAEHHAYKAGHASMVLFKVR